MKIVAEVPGVRPEDVKVSIENSLLTIRGEKKQQAEETTERVHRYERNYGTFERTFALPTTQSRSRQDRRELRRRPLDGDDSQGGAGTPPGNPRSR